VEVRLLCRKLRGQHAVRGGGHCRRKRGAWIGSPVQGIELVAPVDGVERVVDRRVGHGVEARLFERVPAGGGRGLRGGEVPINHDVGPADGLQADDADRNQQNISRARRSLFKSGHRL